MAYSKAQAKILAAILDQLIPANAPKGIPGAGELGVAEFLARQAASCEAVQEAIATLLQRSIELTGKLTGELADEVTPALVRQLETELPGPFAVLLTETYKGYYSRPDMRAKMGVGAPPVHPAGYAVTPESPALLDQLTAPVRARGAVFRDPTGGQE